MTRLTDEELAAIEAREKAATPGPWFVNVNDLIGGKCVGTVNVPASESNEAGCICDMMQHDEDGTFIAHARTDVGRLLADLRAAREEADRWITAYGVERDQRVIAEGKLRAAQKVVEAARTLPQNHEGHPLYRAIAAYDASGKGAGDAS